jgi:hypothetical protein
VFSLDYKVSGLIALKYGVVYTHPQKGLQMPRGKATKTVELINAMESILRAIHPASVRAVCYQLFIREMIKSMNKSATNGVSHQLVYARETGIIPWEHVVDETREAEGFPGWDSKTQFKDAYAKTYALSQWQNQPIRIQVWSEKGTVRGTLKPLLDQYGIQFFPVHGFSSATAINDIVDQQCGQDIPLNIIYAGDHDPSGLYMPMVDLPKRFARLWELKKSGKPMNITIEHVALSSDDCDGLPSFPAKKTDPRYNWYIEHYGHKAWELDAMNPEVLRQRVEEAILRQPIDWDAWKRTKLCSDVELTCPPKTSPSIS